MNSADKTAGTQSRRSRNGTRVIAGLILAAVLVIGIAAFAVLEGDVPEAAGDLVRPFSTALHRFGHLAPIGLLYAEESGVPMPLPGDVFVMYVGRYLPRSPAAWIAAGVALVLVVTLGASNLFWLSRRLGTRLPEHRVGRFLHVTPQRLARAQRWFDRHGPVALIFGRHIPGFRVPLTIAAGVCGVRYRTFAASVAVSSGIWVGVFLSVGIIFGGRLEELIRVHKETYLIVPAVLAVAVGIYAVRRLVLLPQERLPE